MQFRCGVWIVQIATHKYELMRGSDSDTIDKGSRTYSTCTPHCNTPPPIQSIQAVTRDSQGHTRIFFISTSIVTKLPSPASISTTLQCLRLKIFERYIMENVENAYNRTDKIMWMYSGCTGCFMK